MGNQLCPATGAFISELLTCRPHPEQGFRSALGVLRLAKRYGNSRLEAAWASACQSFSHKSVESILKHNLHLQPLGERALRRVHTFHSNVRGPNYYQ